MEKAERNAAYVEKLERGLAQVRAGQGIVKTVDELEALAAQGLGKAELLRYAKGMSN